MYMSNRSYIYRACVGEVIDNMECPEKMRSYMEALEEERLKIQVFQRELPLCLDLVTQAIEACKQRLSGTTSSMEGTNGQMSECSEQNLMDGHPALEEFIPIKRTLSSDNHHERDEEEEEDDDDDNGGGDEQHSGNYGDSDEKKSNWLKSAQLWNPNPEAITHDDEDSPPPPPFRGSGLDGKANCGVFRRFPTVEKVAGKSSLSSGKDAAAPLPSTAAASTSSTAEKGGGATGNREEKQRPSTRRKPRRCWSVDLHRRFMHAVQQLGGPHVATPKQIKELMKVEDLTSDEVKSHLQKYRLHSKNSPRHSSGNAQPPQFVVVGGIWVPPPPHYAAAAAATIPGAAHGTYAPVVAAVPPEDAQRRVVWTAQEKPLGLGSQGFEAHGSSNSTTTSTSTHTVTVC